jgi:hypothetical protein
MDDLQNMIEMHLNEHLMAATHGAVARQAVEQVANDHGMYPCDWPRSDGGTALVAAFQVVAALGLEPFVDWRRGEL